MSKPKAGVSVKSNRCTFRLLALGDVHAPYHHPGAWACALDVLARGGFDGVVQVGDLNSFDSVSTHHHDPKKVLPLEKEIAGANVVMDELDAACRAGGVARQNRWILEGNHDVRLDRYALQMAPELRPFIDWREMLHLDRRGWRVVPYKESLVFGKARLTHDVGRAGVNAARQSVQDVGDNIIIGHTHRLQAHYQGTQVGKRHVGATIGWLGDPEFIDYRHRDMVRREWCHGVATLEFLADGTFWLQLVPIIHGRCVINGAIYGQLARVPALVGFPRPVSRTSARKSARVATRSAA